jgi:excisionase family DNA binding protein
MAKKSKTPGGRNGANGSGALTVITEREAWFTPETLAAYLQVSDRQVRNWVSEGLLVSYKIGSSRRFDPLMWMPSWLSFGMKASQSGRSGRRAREVNA